MPLQLLICRHAEAISSSSGTTDFNRDLTVYGQNQAINANKWLSHTQVLPDYVVSSAASRAYQTAKLISSSAESPLLKEKDLYDAHAPAYLKIINALPDTATTVLLVGHNPGISELAEYLTGQSFNLDPCQMIRASFEADNWTEVIEGSANILGIYQPER